MSTHAEDHKLDKAKAHIATAEKEVLSEMKDIRENVVGLARDIRDTSARNVHEAADYLGTQVDHLRTSGTEALHTIERRVRSNPAQSVALAFAAGLLASYVFGHRKP